MNEKKKTEHINRGTDGEPFDVQATNPYYGGAWMSDVALALVRPTNPKVVALIEARREGSEDC